jgi:hypothetical protein
MVINNGNLAITTNQVQQGLGGAAGIVSSTAMADSTHLTAIGVIQNDNGSGSPLYSSFGGVTGLTNTAVLVKYTYYGDTNLDGKVDGSDYSRIDNGALNRLTGWFNGDFNYDGVVNGSDYTLIDNAFNMQGAQISSEIVNPTAQVAGTGTITSAVPEPATLGLLGFGAARMLGRQRQRKLMIFDRTGRILR